MKNNIYFNIYARKENGELFDVLKKSLAGKQVIDARALLAIKTILASRNLSETERTEFELLTKGETFEKIDNALKPSVLIFANTHNEEINPMLGPSGVSIVHKRP